MMWNVQFGSDSHTWNIYAVKAFLSSLNQTPRVRLLNWERSTGKIECCYLQPGGYPFKLLSFFFFFFSVLIHSYKIIFLAGFISLDLFNCVKDFHYVTAFWSHQPEKLLGFMWKQNRWWNQTFFWNLVYLQWIYCFPSYMKNETGGSHTDIQASAGWWCDPGIVVDACLKCLELLSPHTFFFYLLHTNPRVIPTTAFHIHGQTTEWRHIHVCFGSRIHIFMIWEPCFSSVQAAKVWIGVVCFSIKDVSLSIARRRKFDLLCLL